MLLEECFVWCVFHQLLLALQECYRQRQGVHKVKLKVYTWSLSAYLISRFYIVT